MYLANVSGGKIHFVNWKTISYLKPRSSQLEVTLTACNGKGLSYLGPVQAPSGAPY